MSGSVAERVLAGLKDFQRTTVDYVFERLHAPGSSGRFLVADEVGLGKTKVAQGVIAKTIDELRRKAVRRIDVVYVCSNADIARQNMNRLKVGEEQHVQLASRLTLLPRDLHRLEQTTSGVNFISFTPTTSLDLDKSAGLGRVDERVILYWMLRQAWDLGSSRAPLNVFQGDVSPERFRRKVDQFDLVGLAERSHQDFARALTEHEEAEKGSVEGTLRARFDEICRAYSRSDSDPGAEMRKKRYHLVGTLRAILAASAIHALEPDLIILDEFQRFAHLLDDEDDASRLARALFTYRDVKVLLLSATPYRMFTTTDEAHTHGEDHYADFVRTLRFLERRDGADKSLDRTVTEYRESLVELARSAGQDIAGQDIAGRRARVLEARTALETRLRTVMVRTERLASTPDRNGMLVETPAPPARIEPGDLAEYRALQKVAREIDVDDTLELWKSAPYLLNFIEKNYQLRNSLDLALVDDSRRAGIARVLQGAPSLAWSDVERFADLDPRNARMRALLDDLVGSGAWQLLWVPPCLPYYRLAGAFADPAVAKFSKRLVFSSWRVVPRVIAALVSYHAERRMLEHDPEARNAPERRGRGGQLRFSFEDGRPTGMPVLALLYPSLYLAKACNPAALLAERASEQTHNGPASVEGVRLEDVLEIARQRIAVGLRRLGGGSTDGPIDERWYWAAPLLLDAALDRAATVAWFEQPDLAAIWSGRVGVAEEDESASEDDSGAAVRPSEARAEDDAWTKHVAEACRVAQSGLAGLGSAPLGRQPEDLVEVLAEIAVAGPAVAMFRALDRVVGGQTVGAETRTILRNGAARIAWSFRALFNRGPVSSMLRGGVRGRGDAPYWRQVLRYCADGCLPAVLDEYAHVLRDHLGLAGDNVEHRVHEMANEMREALELRRAQVRVREYVIGELGSTVRAVDRSFSSRFAARFSDESYDDGTTSRADHVRRAFNSPFWPFVLASTSVGQEGLDFHTYCHHVVHWNLPSNPVDLEQREGRVHRYKGHAIRRNVSREHGWAALASEATDVWEAMFDEAHRAARAAGHSDIVPFWVYATEGGARIQRHVLALPLSREHHLAGRLRSSLAIYRMVFGQPRQEDLMQCLLGRVAPEALDEMIKAARIDLTPSEPLRA